MIFSNKFDLFWTRTLFLYDATHNHTSLQNHSTTHNCTAAHNCTAKKGTAKQKNIKIQNSTYL